MSPEEKLERLCRRHGVPPMRGARLLPLVRRALAADGELRERLLAVVRATLTRDAEELARSERFDQRCLLALGGALHRWPGRGASDAGS
jgi:hypothetical protein